MSLNFKVQKVEEYQGLPDGAYTAQVEHIEQVSNDFGNYYVVHWRILTPFEFEGNAHRERYNVGHKDERVRKFAISNFSKFCMEIGSLSEDDDLDEKHVLFRVAEILIRNKVAKDGNKYANVVKHTLVEPQQASLQPAQQPAVPPANTVQYGNIAIPTAGAVSNQALNDDVPF